MKKCMLVTVCLVALACLATAQQNEPKPLTNADVIAMFKGGLDSPTIICAIQSQDTDFDISATGLLLLKKNAVPPKVLDAVIASAGKKKASVETAAATKSAADSQAKSKEAPNHSVGNVVSAKPGQPRVSFIQDGKNQLLPITQTQIIQTKAKPANLAALATDANMTQAMSGVTQTVAAAGSMRGSSKVVSTAMMANPMIGGAMMAGSLFAHHMQRTITEVWAIPGVKSETVIHNAQPSFEVQCGNIPGINPDDYKPVLLKLEPTPNNFRLVGATEAKTDALQTPAADWSMYSSFVEELGPSRFTKVATGVYQLQASSSLAPGEYAVALRPSSKDQKFSGSSISQNTGDGLVFNSVWAFSIAQ